MAMYVLEAPHDAGEHTRALRETLAAGPGYQHLFVWGCDVGEHKAWAVVEADGQGEVVDLLPRFLQERATVHRVRLHSAKDVAPFSEEPD